MRASYTSFGQGEGVDDDKSGRPSRSAWASSRSSPDRVHRDSICVSVHRGQERGDLGRRPLSERRASAIVLSFPLLQLIMPSRALPLVQSHPAPPIVASDPPSGCLRSGAVELSNHADRRYVKPFRLDPPLIPSRSCRNAASLRGLNPIPVSLRLHGCYSGPMPRSGWVKRRRTSALRPHFDRRADRSSHPNSSTAWSPRRPEEVRHRPAAGARCRLLRARFGTVLRRLYEEVMRNLVEGSRGRRSGEELERPTKASLYRHGAASPRAARGVVHGSGATARG